MLYLVGTPIGNMEDITLRGLATLKKADVIACEDTRHSAPFLNRYEVHAPLISYHKFNEREQTPRILELLKEGKEVALITDAGMPCISDPGAVLVKAARAEGLDVCVVPGATAAVSALCLSGVSTGYVFLGFLPDKRKDAEEALAPFTRSPLPLVFYCGCHDLAKYAEWLYEILGDRPLTVVKEITKLHEAVEETTLAAGFTGDTRGEFVLIVGGFEAKENWDSLTVEEHLSAYLKLGLDKKEAVKRVAAERKVKKDEIYKVAIKMGEE